MTPASGQTFAGHLIVRRLGSGAMGQVFEAKESLSGRHVAMKVIHDHLGDDESYSRRFRHEVRAMAAVEHVNVVPIITSGDDAGALYFTMRLIEGGFTLADVLRGGYASRQVLMSLMAGAAAGLDACHERGVIHRDVKPSNVLVDRNAEVALLGDFGIAWADDLSRMTNGLIGTLPYMAPELLEGADATACSDVFSFACVVYEALTRERVRPEPVLVSPRRERIAAPSEVDATLTRRVDDVLLAALSRRPSDRPPNAAGLMVALCAALEPRTTAVAPAVSATHTSTVDIDVATVLVHLSDEEATLVDPRRGARSRRKDQHFLLRRLMIAVLVALGTPVAIFAIRAIAH